MATRSAAFEKKNIVITGGAGFLGSHLCDILVQRHKVICIDNFSTGDEQNIHHLLSNPNFEFVRHDMAEPIDLAALRELKAFQVPFQGVQEIYHLASPSSPKDYTRLTVETLLANALGTKNALDLTKQFSAKFLLVSSGSTYGEPVEKTPFPENYFGYVNPIGVRSPYQEGKRFAEALTVAYRTRFKLEAKIVRLFNTYGPRMRLNDGRMIPEFIGMAIKNLPIAIHGSKEDVATYCFVSDALEGLTRMMSSKEPGPINIGHPEEHTVGQIAEQVVALTGSRPDFRMEPPLPYDAKQATPSVRQARELLGWFPVVPLEEGLRRTIDYMRGLRQVGLASLGFGDQG
ncbi:MAG: GDP-mannose 4,6-dehydratase [Patescibacteria group bacterium]